MQLFVREKKLQHLETFFRMTVDGSAKKETHAKIEKWISLRIS
jgi:hypothetical protein